MLAHSKTSPEDIDVTSLWSVMKRAGLKILAVSALLGAAAYGVLSLVPSRYASEAQILIGGQGVNDPFRDPKVGAQATPEAVTVKVDKEAIASQVIALRSRDLAVKLAAELKLRQMPEFNSALPRRDLPGRVMRMLGLEGPRPGETEEDRVLSAFYRSLRVYQGKDTRVITIEFTSENPELAARAANRLGALYQERLRAQGVSQTADASEWLRPQIAKLTKEVRDAEAEVERFRSEANLFRGSGQHTGLNEQQLSELTAEMTRVSSQRAEADARARSARELFKKGMVEAISDVQKSPLIQALIAQRVRAEREKAEAETVLLPGHPRMKQLAANVADLKRQISREATGIVEALEKDARILALREDGARQQLDNMKQRVGAKAGDMARLASLEGAAKAKRRELEGLQASFEAARSRGDLRSVPLDAQTISQARPSSVPVFPKKGPIALLTAAATLILGLVGVITRELLRGGRAAAPQPRPVPAEPSLARTGAGRLAVASDDLRSDLAPRSAVGRAPSTEPMVAAGDGESVASSAAEVAHRLAAKASGEYGHRALLAYEVDPGEAWKQATALASTLTADGRKVILADWSRSGEGACAGGDVVPATPGMTDLLDGAASFEDVIHPLPGTGAHVIACGAASAGEPDAERINLILDALDEAYDHVVVVAAIEPARDLFQAILGRFDAGVLVADGRRRSVLGAAGPGTFLGFEVTDIDVIRLEATGSPQRKLQLSRKPAPVVQMRV